MRQPASIDAPHDRLYCGTRCRRAAKSSVGGRSSHPRAMVPPCRTAGPDGRGAPGAALSLRGRGDPDSADGRVDGFECWCLKCGRPAEESHGRPRKYQPRRCRECGQPIGRSRRSDARFCSAACKDRYHNSRRSPTYTRTHRESGSHQAQNGSTGGRAHGELGARRAPAHEPGAASTSVGRQPTSLPPVRRPARKLVDLVALIEAKSRFADGAGR